MNLAEDEGKSSRNKLDVREMQRRKNKKRKISGTRGKYEATDISKTVISIY